MRTADQQAEYGRLWRLRNAARVKAYREENREKRLAQHREWAANNRERKRALHQKWTSANPEKVSAKNRDWVLRNKERNSRRQAEYRALNRDRMNAISAGKRARQRNATPPWLTKEHKAAIVAVYAEAQRLSVETGISHHVDHIAPLAGKTACGLHVPWNLQVLPATENIRKGNGLAAEVLAALMGVLDMQEAA